MYVHVCAYMYVTSVWEKSRKSTVEVIYLSCHNFILSINHGASNGEKGTTQAFVTKIQRCAASYPIVSEYSIFLSRLLSDAYYLRDTYRILPRRIRLLPIAMEEWRRVET